MKLRCGERWLDLSSTQIMGILNVTPDSFSDGGRYLALDKAIDHAQQMINEGAAIIDIGGESTRPGSAPVSESEELERTIPVVEALRCRFDVVLSIDTSKAAVMTEAVKAGADMINDVRALREEGALEAAARTDAAICLMHMQGKPRTMQHTPRYADVVSEVREFLAERVQLCHRTGIDGERLVLDPGLGFGKTLEHNYRLLAEVDHLIVSGLPMLVGLSRKRMIGDLLGRSSEERLVGSVVGALLAAQRGASILRVHDVAETQDALKVWQKTRLSDQ